MPKLVVDTFGRKGVNANDSPIHLSDDDLQFGQNAELSLEDGYPAIRKRRGIAVGVTSAMSGTIHAVTSIPLGDPAPKTALVIELPAGVLSEAADGSSFAIVLPLVGTAHGGRKLSIGPSKLYRGYLNVTKDLMSWDGTNNVVEQSLTNDFLQSGNCIFVSGAGPTIYWAQNHNVYVDFSPVGLSASGFFSASNIIDSIHLSGFLYVATSNNVNSSTAVKVYRWEGGTTWTLLGTVSDSAHYQAWDMWAHDGTVYVATSVGLGRVVGSTFSRHVATGNFRGLFSWDGFLFTAERSGNDTILARSTDGGTTRTTEATLTASTGTLGAKFCSYKGELYAAVHALGVYKRDDTLQTWSQVYSNTGCQGQIGAY